MYLCAPLTRRGPSDDLNFLCLSFPGVFVGHSHIFPHSQCSPSGLSSSPLPRNRPEYHRAAPEKLQRAPFFSRPHLHKCQEEVVLSPLCISHPLPLNPFSLHVGADVSCKTSPLKLETSITAAIIRRGSLSEQLCVRERGKLLVLKR